MKFPMFLAALALSATPALAHVTAAPHVHSGAGWQMYVAALLIGVAAVVALLGRRGAKAETS